MSDAWKYEAHATWLSIPCYRADGTKVAVKQRALGAHALYEYKASFMGAFGKRLFEPSELSHQNIFFSSS